AGLGGGVAAGAPELNGVADGIQRGISGARQLLRLGFGEIADPAGRLNDLQPTYPLSAIFLPFRPLPTNAIPAPTQSEPDPGFWSILRRLGGTPLEQLAFDIVTRGDAAALKDVPVARFRNLRTVDRTEIESYRGVSNVIRE